MPVHREPLLIETLVDDGLGRLKSAISQVIRANDALPHWLNDLERLYLHGFSIGFGIGIIWIFISYVSSWGYRRIATSQKAKVVGKTDDSSSAAGHVTSSQPFDNNATSTTQEKTALERIFGNKWKVSSSKNHHQVHERTGRVSSPGYQTPFTVRSSKQDFSGLAKTAPICYDTLQRNGMLNQDGTPTKKYTSDLSKRSSLAGGEVVGDFHYDSPIKT